MEKINTLAGLTDELIRKMRIKFNKLDDIKLRCDLNIDFLILVIAFMNINYFNIYNLKLDFQYLIILSIRIKFINNNF